MGLLEKKLTISRDFLWRDEAQAALLASGQKILSKTEEVRKSVAKRWREGNWVLMIYVKHFIQLRLNPGNGWTSVMSGNKYLFCLSQFAFGIFSLATNAANRNGFRHESMGLFFQCWNHCNQEIQIKNAYFNYIVMIYFDENFLKI